MSTSTLQRYTNNLLSVHLGHLTIRENTRPDWLITRRGERLELDFFIEELEAAIEVQGEQHYRYVPFFHGDYRGYESQKRRDDFKRQTCAQAGVTLYEVADELDALDTLENLLSQLVQSEHFVPTILKRKKADLQQRRERIIGKKILRYVGTHYRKIGLPGSESAKEQARILAHRYGVKSSWARGIMNQGLEKAHQIRRERNRREKKKRRDKKKRNTTGYIFLLESTAGGWRIGYSTNPQRRAEEMRFMIPGHECWLYYSLPSDNFREGAAEIQSWFEDKRFIGNWFNLEPGDIEKIKAIKEHRQGVWIIG